MAGMSVRRILSRFLTPAPVVTAYCLLKFGAKVSPRAEVELSPNLKLGKGTVVSSFTKIKSSDGPMEIGARGGFATGCFVAAGPGGLRVGDNLICGPNVSIVATNYVTEKPDVHFEDQGSTSRGISIGRNVWIGSNCTIVDGAAIGNNTIVVANSLVNRRFPDNCILQGNPAKVILKRTF